MVKFVVNSFLIAILFVGVSYGSEVKRTFSRDEVVRVLEKEFDSRFMRLYGDELAAGLTVSSVSRSQVEAELKDAIDKSLFDDQASSGCSTNVIKIVKSDFHERAVPEMLKDLFGDAEEEKS